jgi:dipeptidyl aminopeptidase/acylaminoacyl peptidase
MFGRSRAAIALFDPSTGEEVKELFSDPVYDAGGVRLSRVDHHLLGFTCERDKPTVVWTDQRMQILQTLIDREFPATKNDFTSRSDDLQWMIVFAHSDRDPGTYYMLNTTKPTLEQLVVTMPWIKPAKMAEMRPITYQARDGLTIHGYLSLPAGSDGKNLPLIVNPHGGPWVRDEWGFNPEIQFFASRGYAVLQMNFRGSTGYGSGFEAAGFGQWGLSMQDDITDGVKWAIAQGIADPKHIAIYGASYGGYAAMAGLAFTPELYCCGINYVGVTDIKLLLKTLPKSWNREIVEAMTGNSKRDGKQLEATSPMDHPERIRVPVLFAYGRLDDRVDLKHGTEMAGDLRARGIPVTLIVRQDEGHGFRHWDNKIELYKAMEEFLGKYLAK